MAEAKQQIVYWGATPLDIAEPLAAHAKFFVVGKDLTAKEAVTDDYRDALFLLGVGAPVWDDPALFALLPANAILYDERCSLSAEIEHIADLKNAQALDFTDRARLVHIIHYDYFPGRWAFKLPFDTLRVANTFTGDVIQNGQAGCTLQGDFGADFTTIATWTQSSWSYADWYETFYPECQFSAHVDVRLTVRVVTIADGELVSTHTLDGDHLQQGVTFYVGKKNSFIMVSVAAKGEGSVTLGRQHVNRTREGYGHLFVGGKMVSDYSQLAQGVATYFDAGDLKPPLMVYFSGWHGAETFEGNFMMRMFRAPYLLVTDNRLEGGAFYYGSALLEQKIVDVIQDTLHRLGFGPHDLIFMGLSMGTNAALYFGAQLLPRAIVVGKPLPELGTVARNGRLLRPDEFGEAEDMLLLLEGSTDERAITAVNNHFWEKFKLADFSHTILAIAYMKQDDYQPDAFARLYQQLSKQNGRVQLLHKGIIGRHNDNTTAVINWFMRIARLTLQNEFDRQGVFD